MKGIRRLLPTGAALVWLMVGVAAGLGLSPMIGRKQEPVVPMPSGEGRSERSTARKISSETSGVAGFSVAELNAEFARSGAGDATRREEAAAEFAARVRDGEIPQAVAAAQGLPTGAFKERFLRSLLRRWAAVDFDAAFAWVKERPPGLVRRQSLDTVITTLAERDASRALQLLQGEVLGDTGRQLEERVCAQWAAATPSAAAAYVLKATSGERQLELLATIAREWAQVDATTAVTWVEGLPPGPRRDTAMRSLLRELGVSAPEPLGAFVRDLPDDRLGGEASGLLAASWARGDLEGALNWCRNLPEGTKRNAAFFGVMQTWAEADPATAAAFGQALPGEKQGEWLRAVTLQWAQVDPIAAARWTATADMPERLRGALLPSLIGAWAHSDPRPAADYAAQLPLETRSSALIEVAGGWSQTHPQDAAMWAAGLTNTSLGFELLRTVVANWTTYEPREAEQWVQRQSQPIREALSPAARSGNSPDR